MSRNALAIVLLALAGLMFGSALHLRLQKPAPMMREFNAAPLPLEALQDEQGAPAQLRGQYLLLNLWAPWCGPCLQEMPSLERLAADAPNLKIVPVLEDDTPERARAAFARIGISRLNFYRDPESALRKASLARGFPTTILLDRNGAPIAIREGEADWDNEALRGQLRRLTP